jgi:glutaredoxin
MRKNFLSFLFLGVILLSSCTSNDLSSTPILFYGEGCPHCALVESYLSEQKISLSQKEVYHNTDNASELALYAKHCNMDTKNIGVPFLWTGKECLSGDEPIITYLKKQR